MKLAEKLQRLQDEHFGEWLNTRKQVEGELSDAQSMFCVCGRLATGLHEASCRRFQRRVNEETVERLKHLLV